jgi:hypothetical protein
MNNLPCFLLSLAIVLFLVSYIVGAIGGVMPAVYCLAAGIVCVFGFFKMGGFQEDSE